MKPFVSSCLLGGLLLFVVSASAQLSVMDPQRVGSKSAFIDEATIVIEPRGGFVHQSIYLEYGDHSQFPGNNNLEITHQFELPPGSAVNDLWLWIGDNVMKGTLYDVWTGRHIYDSIVVRKIDPAFMTKNGSRYDLKVYPLVSGQRRKVKISVIAPTRWVGGTASAELPLALLKGSAATTKPVRVLFKKISNIWGTPRITELPFLTPKSTFDSVGYNYAFFQVADVSHLTSMSMKFFVGFPGAVYAPPIERRGDSTYFQVGIDPVALGVASADTGKRSVAIGLDLSGTILKGLNTTISRARTIVHRAVRTGDRFRLFAARPDSITAFGSWCRGDSVAIDSLFAAFSASPFAAAYASMSGPRIVFCDKSALDLWSFPGLDTIARVSKYNNIVDAAPHFADADIVASYRHGNEDSYLQKLNITMLRGRVDSLLMRGGRFLAFFDYNRTGQEAIASPYITDLKTTLLSGSYPSETLHAFPGGLISAQFLPTYVTGSVNYLSWTGEGVVKELGNAAGTATVITRPVHKGQIVVSGLWTFSQSLEVRKSLATALLGFGSMTVPGGRQQLRPLLGAVHDAVSGENLSDVIVMSNGDSVTSVADARAWAATHVGSYGPTPPVFSTVNLLDGSLYVPGVIPAEGVEYYGGGFQLYALASASGGQHLESHIRDWGYITSALTYSSIPRMDSLLVTVTPAGGPGSVREQVEIDPEPGNPTKPRFIIGLADSTTSLKFDIYAWFSRTPGVSHREATSFGVLDSASQHVIASMLGRDRLTKQFATSSTDTAGIVATAMSYNLLCDYTSFLCLEPDARHRPLRNPLDESKFVTRVRDDQTVVDSLTCGAFPNPFNGQTTITVRLPRVADVRISIFNMLGQQVRAVAADAVSGEFTTAWNATNDRGMPVASGVYIVQVGIRDHSSGRVEHRSLRLMLLK